MTAQASCHAKRCSRFSVWGRQLWPWDCVEQQLAELQRALKARNSSISARACLLCAQLAAMQIDTDRVSARIDDLIGHVEKPRETTMLRVL